MRSLKFFATEEEYALLLKWASRRGPTLSSAELERVQARAEVLAAILERWDPVGVQAAPRCVAEQIGLRLD